MVKIKRSKKLYKGRKKEQQAVQQALAASTAATQRALDLLEQQIKERQPLTQTAVQAATQKIQEISSPDNQKQATAASDFIKSRALDLLNRLQRGEDIAAVMPEYAQALQRAADVASRARAVARTSGIGAFAYPQLSPTDVARLDEMAAAETRNALASSLSSMLPSYIQQLQQAALTGQDVTNQYNQQLLSTLMSAGNYGSATPLLSGASSTINSLINYGSYINRPGQGIFSRYVLPIAQLGVDALAKKCVAANTRIQTPNGDTQIQHIVLGERVNTVCSKRGLRTQPVFVITSAPVDDWLRVKTEDGRQIDVTPDHEFLTPNGPVTADALSEGALIAFAEGSGIDYTKVKSIKRLKSSRKRAFYNIMFASAQDEDIYFIANGLITR